MSLPIQISDPFTLFYDKLIECLLTSPGMKLVMPNIEANLISYNRGAGQDQLRTEVKDTDLPELQLVSRTISGNFNVASNAVNINREYSLLLSAGTGRLGSTLYPIEWAITCALTDINKDSRISELAWHGAKFVRSLALTSSSSGDSDPERNRGIQGWAAVWSFTVLFMFPQSMLRQFNQGVQVANVGV